jgi:hypothetical protein
MKKASFVLSVFCLFIGCKKAVSNVVADAGEVTYLTDYSYEYDSSGKIVSQKEATYAVMFGRIVDTIFTTKRVFEYNSVGLLERETAYDNNDEKPEIHVFLYNRSDSLIADISISSEGDTTRYIKYDYFPDGRKIIFSKDVFASLPPDPDFLVLSEFVEMKKDTLIFTSKYVYENGRCKNVFLCGRNGNPESITEYEYKGDRLFKAIRYTFENEVKIFDLATFYDYSKSLSNPDYFSLNADNDTIEKCINEFENDRLVASINIRDQGSSVEKIFYREDGKETGSIVADERMNFTRREWISYDEKGNVKEIRYVHGEMGGR